MITRRLSLVLLAFLLLPAPSLWAQTPSGGAGLTLERIFESGELSPDGFDGGRWLPDGSGWIRLETREGAQAVLAHDAASGSTRDVLVASSSLVPAGADAPLDVAAWERADEGPTWLFRTRGDGWWTLDEAPGGRLTRIGGPRWADLSAPALSPTGDRVAYAIDNDMWVEDFATGRVTRLTADGSETLLNGTGGVYSGMSRSGFRWSPDGRRIAFVQFDASGVPTFPIINYTDSLYASVVRRSHVKPGGTLPAARLGVVGADGGDVTWVELPGDPRMNYVWSFEWVPGSDELLVAHLARPPQAVTLYRADPRTGAVREILADREDSWVDPQPVVWLDGGRSVLWVSERDGWRHVYRVPIDGGRADLLTPGDFEILSVEGVDEDAGLVYFIASPEDAGQRYLYRARLDGTGGVERVTPDGSEREGTHEYDIAPGGRWAWHTFSTIDTPPVTDLVSLPDHERVRVVQDNAALADRLRALDLPPTEFFRVDIGDGVELDGWMMKPPDFDPDARYPLLLYVYGMPAGQTVLDRWGGGRHLYHHMLTRKGYVVASLDNRGTPAPRGRDWRRSIYLVHGVLPAQDQAAGVRAMEARWPWLDPARTGIYGWSGGGNVSMHSILRHGDVFELAMPGAGITDHRYYHAGFTERFLGLPQDHPDAYDATAPAQVAGNLEGDLLILHGTGDPNVHFQNAQVLVNALIDAKKRFTFMPYPNRPHGVPDRVHLHDLYIWFLEQHMPPGPAGAGTRDR